MKWSPRDVIAVILAASVPLVLVLFAIHRITNPDAPAGCDHSGPWESITMAIIGGMIGWMGRDRIDNGK